jgi:hypothetical protein
MKKRIIIIISSLIILIIGILATIYLLSFHQITFNIKQSNLTINLYKQDKKMVSFNTETYVANLQSGDYIYKVSGGLSDGVVGNFTIDNSSKNIDLDPDYSETYLKSLLSKENSQILSILNSTYPTIINDYEISYLTLYKKGEWCGAVVSKKVESGNISDKYRVIFNKIDGNWKMIHYPEIIATKNNFPNIPADILDKVNNLAL